jgi:isoquinoline 1-oxidoreductase alpha subunit
MAASALLARIPQPTDEDIDQSMNRNLCRCGTYVRIREGIHRAAAMRADDPEREGGADSDAGQRGGDS